jgi:hypothetical protein
MSCCGGKRKQFLSAVQSQQSTEPTKVVSHIRPAPRGSIYFEYVGSTGLTAVGPITGKRYRFSHSGAQIEVDSRDAPSFIAVPNLRPVKDPLVGNKRGT